MTTTANSGCQICSDTGKERCKQEYCFGQFNPAFTACGEAHIDVQFAPDQCISAGEPMFVGEDGKWRVWVSGEAKLPTGIAYTNYRVDEDGFTNCNHIGGNVWICGVFQAPDHLLPIYCAILSAGKWSDFGNGRVRI